MVMVMVMVMMVMVMVPPAAVLGLTAPMHQAFIESFEYNYTGTNFYNVTGVKNDQSLLRVLSIAKECERQQALNPESYSPYFKA